MTAYQVHRHGLKRVDDSHHMVPVEEPIGVLFATRELAQADADNRNDLNVQYKPCGRPYAPRYFLKEVAR